MTSLAPTLDPHAARSRWYDSPRLWRIAGAAFVLFLVVQGVVAVGFKEESDFQGHIITGQLLMSQGPGAVPWDWYPLGRIVWNAGLALVTPEGAKLFSYLLSLAAGAGMFYLWRRLAPLHSAASFNLDLAAFGLAVVACLTYVRRDLDECGAHILLAFFLTASAYGIKRSRPVQSGLWLAAAITYKNTPLLFLPLLLWKRQWKACAWAIAFTLLFNVAPAAWLGWRETMDYHQRWLARACEFASQRDPASHVVEPPKYLNQSLKSALARLVQNYPRGHSLHLGHPAFVQFVDLDVDAARRFVTLAMISLLAAVGWRMRRRSWAEKKVAEKKVSGTFSNGQLAFEWAAMGVLATLLSPFCWKQHLVATLPAIYLVIRHQLLERECLPPAGGRVLTAWRWRTAAICLFAGLTLFAARGVLSAHHAELALSYKVFTVAGLISLALVLTLPVRPTPACPASTAQRCA